MLADGLAGHPLRLATLAASPYAEVKGTALPFPLPLDSRLRGNDDGFRSE